VSDEAWRGFAAAGLPFAEAFGFAALAAFNVAACLFINDSGVRIIAW
jgi:hypothetical protein